MPRGSKAKYTDKQKRKAAHIEESYRDRGVPKDEAEARAWATVNKQSGGGERNGGGGQRTSSAQKRSARQSSAEHAVQTRKIRSGDEVLAQSLTRDELMELARLRDIRGRSRMRKNELIEALRKAA